MKTILAVFVAVLQLSCQSSARTVKRDSCNSVLSATSGTFSSPKHPGVYDTELRCSWTIEGSEAVTEILISFEKFDVEWGMNCRFDSVTVKDKDGNFVGGKMCGSAPREVTVPGNLAVVTLSTDDYDGDNTGFSAKYKMNLPGKKGDCNFDKPCSDWTNGHGDVIWQNYVTGQSSDAVLPKKDHSGNGGYKYVSSVKKGQKATLQSPVFTGKKCMRFFYYMDGLFDIGTLRVYAQTTGQTPSELWSLSGNQGRIWKEADVAINSENEYKVFIEAEAGSYPSMDVIAIDDISFVPIEECKTQPACGGELSGTIGTFTSESHPYEHYARCTWKIQAPQGTAAVLIYFPFFNLHPGKENFVTVKGGDSKEKTIHGVYHEGVGVKVLGSEAEVIYHSGYIIQSGKKGFQARYEAIPFISPDDCDFDNGLCNNWVDNGGFKWVLNKYNTPSLFTGPHGDTLAIGQYVYIESSHVSPGTKARLVSPQLTGAKCLSFAYNMGGYEMGSINVRLSVSGEDTEKLVWSQTGDHGRKWHTAHVSLDDPGAKYKVIFEGVTGSSFTSDAALDDIRFTNGKCPKTKECGGYLTDESGTLENPQFSGSADCKWNIVPPQQYFKVFLKLDINLQNSDDCSSNYVQIQDKFGTQIGEKLCSELSGKRIEVQYGGAKVIYHSEDNKNNSFHISYQAGAKRAACGGVIQSTTGSFSSPHFPENYPRDQVCQWEITGAPGAKAMKVLFEYDFEIDDTGIGCAYSYLALYDQNGNEKARLCGSTKPLPITINGRVFTAEFKTDVFQSSKGFKASFVSLY